MGDESFDRLLKQSEVKKILDLKDSTLEQWRGKGLGPKFVRLGRSIRYRTSDLQKYIKNLPSFEHTTENPEARQ